MSFLLSSPSSTVYAMRTLSFWPKQQRNSAPEKKVERISSNTKISTETKQSESDVLRRVWLCRSFLFKFRVAFYFSVLWISVGFFPLVPFSSVFPLSTEVRPVFFPFYAPFFLPSLWSGFISSASWFGSGDCSTMRKARASANTLCKWENRRKCEN